MKQSLKETILRVMILLAGLVTAHFGVTLFLLSDLGADPFNVLIQGLLRTLTGLGLSILTHGITHIAVCVLIILILLLTDRTYIRIGTLICMAFGGPIIDFFSWLLSPLKIGVLPFVAKLGVLAAGCVILAFGMMVVIKSEAGTGPNDLVAVVISDKSQKHFGIIRILTDFSFVLLGALQGGIWGIGTLVCAFLVGPAANFFLPRSEKLTSTIINFFQKSSSENVDCK